LFSLAACTSDSPDDITATEPAFEITSSPITLQPGEETTKCFYFTTPNTEVVAINKWVSDMTPGSHHMIMFRTLTGTQPPDGTVDNCTGRGAPIYGTQIPHDEKIFPTDDGLGKPLAQEVPAAVPSYFQMHYLNTTDEPITASVTVKAYPLVAGKLYTKTDIFATYNNDISIPPGATNMTVTATCDVVLGKFWEMSSHSHKQSIATAVTEGTTEVFASTDWEHPGTRNWSNPSFYTFESGKLTWSCTYNNTGDNATRTVTSGSSAQTDEMCMATGYYFPAVGPRGCILDNAQCRCLL
jgi:hypothetical protein